MSYSRFIAEIFREKNWALLPEIATNYKNNFHSILKSDNTPNPDNHAISIGVVANNKVNIIHTDDYNSAPEDSVAIINLQGEMLKTGGYCSLGTDSIAAMIKAASQSPKVAAIVVSAHSGGGSVSSVYGPSSAMRNSEKPVLGFVDNIAASGAYYVLSFAEEIHASHEMAQVGSIGIVAILVNDLAAQEKEGVKLQFIYPPESDWKNKSFHEALAGNTDLIIKEELTPWASHFQDVVRNNRKGKLNESAFEGILNGRMFYANDAVKAGLIDSVSNMESVILRASELSRKNNIRKIFKH